MEVESESRMAQAPPSGSQSPPEAKPSFGPQSAFSEAFSLVTNPIAFMNQKREAVTSLRSILQNYVLMLAIVPSVVILLSDIAEFDISSAVLYAGLFYILSIAFVVLMAMVVLALVRALGDALAPARAMQLSAYSATPLFLFSVLNLLPGGLDIGQGLGELYAIVLATLGFQILLRSPPAKMATLMLVVILTAYGIAEVVGLAIPGF